MIRNKWLLFVAACVVSSCVLANAGCAATSGSGSSATDGQTLVSTLCGRCHPIERVDGVKKDQAGWTATIARMRSHGLEVTDAQQAAIVAYLVARDAGK